MIELPLDKMTIEEKLQAMESIWSDLCSRAETIPTPDWHERVLAERERRLQNGAEVPEDWDDAKRRIKRDLQ